MKGPVCETHRCQTNTMGAIWVCFIHQFLASLGRTGGLARDLTDRSCTNNSPETAIALRRRDESDGQAPRARTDDLPRPRSLQSYPSQPRELPVKCLALCQTVTALAAVLRSSSPQPGRDKTVFLPETSLGVVCVSGKKRVHLMM